MTHASELEDLKSRLQVFAAERDWDQFHTPKNLAIALSVEAAELLEIFQWLTPEQGNDLTDAQLAQVEEELADVLLYLIRLSDKIGIALHPAALRKLEINAAKYPVEKARANATKYTDL